jgi:hypothetical protein
VVKMRVVEGENRGRRQPEGGRERKRGMESDKHVAIQSPDEAFVHKIARSRIKFQYGC